MRRGLFLWCAGLACAAAPFVWELPQGFPQPRLPVGTTMSAAKVQLGRFLFYDKRLSGNGQQSCASCHEQARAFTDGRKTAIGSTGQTHARNAMSLVNVAYSERLTWANPAMRSLEQQALVPLLGTEPIELGFRRVPPDAVYTKLFPAAFPENGGSMTVENVARALAAFERTILSARSAYDRFHYGNEVTAISDAAKRGEAVFFSDGSGSCFRCHSGFNLGGGPEYTNNGVEGPGVFGFTKRRGDLGKFRAPSVRNIAVTGPYMHDGSIDTLEAVVDHYAAHGKPHADLDARIGTIYLSPQNKKDLLEFLRSLTDEELLHDTRFSDPWPLENAREPRP